MANTRREKEKKKMRYSNAKEVAEKQSRGFELNSIQLPKGVGFLAFKEAGLYKWDICPFVCQEGNPNADSGMVHYERTYWVHKGINPSDDKAAYCCPSKCFGKPCPVCEYANSIRNQPDTDQDLVKSLYPKKRQMFVVIDKNHREKGIQIHEGSYFNGLGELIDNKIDASDEDSPYRTFHHLDTGMSLHISVKPNPPYGNSAENLEMVARKPIDGGMSDEGDVILIGELEVPCLDKCLKEVDYDFLQEMMQGKAESVDNDKDDSEIDESDSVDEPLPKRKKKVDPDEEEDSDLESDDEDDSPDFEVGDMVKYKKYGLCEVVKFNPKTKNMRLEDDNGDLHDNVLPKEVTKSSKVKGKSKFEEDEESEEDEDSVLEPSDVESDESEEDDEPLPKKKGRKMKEAEDEDMDDIEEPSDLDPDEDDDPPPVKKKPGRKPKHVDEDDD